MELYSYLPQKLVMYIENSGMKNEITEIRMRKDKPVQFTLYGKTENTENYIISGEELENIFYRMCDCSVNIYDQEISNGYITLENGCRVGIGGEFYYSNTSGRYLLKNLLSLNVRIVREVNYFENQDMLFRTEIKSMLVIGRPHSGKTSLLKLCAEYLSQNYRVVLCDERKELFNNKINADAIQGIKKPMAIMMAARTLNPQYIICDEIGLREEAEEMLSAVNTGVRFICSAHGETIESTLKRPNIKLLTDNMVFEKIVLVSQRHSKFYIEEIAYV